MSGVVFETVKRADIVSPNRRDVGCFIGFAKRRPGANLPGYLGKWLRDNGWTEDGATLPQPDDDLKNKPVPIENFETFDFLFQWERRDKSGWATWLGAAVRSFFAQGGSRCFVVRVDNAWDPCPPDDEASAESEAKDKKEAKDPLAMLIPSADGRGAAESAMQSWKGIEVIQGLPEASFVCLPDLPELVADAKRALVGIEPEPSGPEEFAELATQPATPFRRPRLPSRGPACTPKGYKAWFRQVNAVGRFLASRRPDMQFVAAVPMPEEGSVVPGGLMKVLAPDVFSKEAQGLASDLEQGDDFPGISSPFIQLVFPWLGTEGSDLLPGLLEPPDGTLAGVLARTVAVEGVHRSLGRQRLRLVSRFSPPMEPVDRVGALMERVTLLGDTPSGPEVLTDVTTSLQRVHRPSSVRRLTAAILRTARSVGEAVVFESSGPELWRVMERRLEDLMSRFYLAGALLGDKPDEAYSVRCDRTTMTQNDIDNGRVVARVEFMPAQPVGTITVVLSLRDGVAQDAGTIG